MKMLLVEDDEALRFLVQIVLQREGHEAVMASRFADVVALPEETWAGIDVAVVDLTLVGGDRGEQIVTWLAEHHPDVVRVVSTAAAVVPEMPTHAVMHKTFDWFNNFVRDIERTVARVRSAAQPEGGRDA